jgi:hypothetical protein
MKRAERARQWEQCVANWKSSGLTQRAYCERESIPYNTFKRWRRHFRKQQDAMAAPEQFIAVQMRSTPTARRGSTPPIDRLALQLSECRVEIRLGNGRGILLDTRFDEEQLGRLLQLLEVLPC